MQFDEQSKVIIDTMTVLEAKAFCKFLSSEIIRHQDDIEQAVKLKARVIEKYGLRED